MCDRCPAGGGWPRQLWPGTGSGGGGGRDYGVNDQGPAPAIRWFPPRDPPKPKWWQGRDQYTRFKFITDGR
jgi:hypothetical protein